MLNVLITGAASGIGKAVKDKFIEEGHFVYAIDINDIEKQDKLVSYKASINDKNRLNEIYDILKQEDIKFDVILDIAGIHKMASFVENDYEEIKRVIDINLLGTMLVNKTFYPLLKKKGRFVIVTSEVASLDPMPFNGLYNVSKTALDSYAQALRQELNLLDQKVVTIRPGAIETPLSSGSMTDTEKLANETKLYSKQASKFSGIARRFMGKPMKAEKLASLIYKASTKRNPRIIYQKHRNIGLVLLNILPKRLQCFVIKLLLK